MHTHKYMFFNIYTHPSLQINFAWGLQENQVKLKGKSEKRTKINLLLYTTCEYEFAGENGLCSELLTCVWWEPLTVGHEHWHLGKDESRILSFNFLKSASLNPFGCYLLLIACLFLWGGGGSGGNVTKIEFAYLKRISRLQLQSFPNA